jgi:hypothetical protein
VAAFPFLKSSILVKASTYNSAAHLIASKIADFFIKKSIGYLYI